MDRYAAPHQCAMGVTLLHCTGILLHRATTINAHFVIGWHSRCLHPHARCRPTTMACCHYGSDVSNPVPSQIIPSAPNRRCHQPFRRCTAFRIRYEDLIGCRVDFRKLESWQGIEIKEEVALSVFVGSTARHRRLGWCERLIISREAAAGMLSLGYSAHATNERQNSVGRHPGDN